MKASYFESHKDSNDDLLMQCQDLHIQLIELSENPEFIKHPSKEDYIYYTPEQIYLIEEYKSVFEKLHQLSIQAGYYWLYCDYTTFYNSLIPLWNSFKTEFTDAEIKDFSIDLMEEINQNKGKVNEYDEVIPFRFNGVFLDFLDKNTLKKIRYSQNKKIEHLSKVINHQNLNDDIDFVEESKSFQLFDKIRAGEYNTYDLVNMLKEFTDNYDLELLESLEYDLGFYLYLKVDGMKNMFKTSIDINGIILELHKQSGHEIHYLKSIFFDKQTEPQEEKLYLKSTLFDKQTEPQEEKLPRSNEPSINMEALMSIFDFYSLCEFKKMIDAKINQRLSQIKQEGNTIQNNLTPVKFHGTKTQFVELVKALITNGNLKGLQKDIFQTLSQIFDVQLKNHEKIISDIANRNNGSETLFLNELQKSLTNDIQQKLEKKNR